MCNWPPIKFTLHVYDLTFPSGGGRVNSGVTGEKAAKPLTTVQHCIATFVSVKLDSFKGPWDSFHPYAW